MTFRPTRIVLSGADENTDLRALEGIVAGKPWIELGILIASKPAPVERYPGIEWIQRLGALNVRFGSESFAPLSLHLCGPVALAFARREKLPDMAGFETVQVNTKGILDQMGPELFSAMWQLGNPVKNIVLQVPDVDHPIVQTFSRLAPAHAGILVDPSGGTGDPNWTCRRPSDPAIAALMRGRIGFAGGIRPDTVSIRHAEISAVLGHENFWMDMESGLRTPEDRFDIQKAKRVVDIMAEIIHSPVPVSASRLHMGSA